MREIKFRAWVKFESGKHGMLDNNCLLDWSLKELLDDEGTDVLMQFTGLKDSKSLDIYEGDLLEGYGKGLVEVSWTDACMELYDNNGAYAGDLREVYSIVTVVGNVHENPELLNPRKHE